MKIFAITAAALLLGGVIAKGQTYSEYKFVFSGTAYQTNKNGALTSWHITDQTLLKSRAAQGNISNLNTVSIVYHINGNSLGDTVDIIDNNGTYLTTEFGFYFGTDSALGRTDVGTAATCGERRVDPIYTFDDSEYTYSNSDSVGASFTYKHYVKGAKGVTNAVIHGTMSWGVIPTGTNTSPILCMGTFTLGKAMFK
ncbi:MAG TPA: hypothetical protein VH595_03915 [Verrucomicrobiae bacterium]|jgi:hypothetical protein|nr:hypothetical protein [Verrucomicrobiae bacterium]